MRLLRNASASSSGAQNDPFLGVSRKIDGIAFRAFEQTALTIVQVGQQGVITSLLRSEANALRIESCNEALTELISLFNVRPSTPPAGRGFSVGFAC